MLDSFLRNLICDSEHEKPENVNIINFGYGDDGTYFVKWENVKY